MTEIRGLMPHEWPLADRHAWAEARRPGGRLSRGGRASHLKPVTRTDLERRYGLYLGFLVRTGRMTPNTRAGVLITPENVASYIADLEVRVSSVTVHGSITKLRRMRELLDARWNSGWIREIEQDLAWEMRPTSKLHRIIDSDRIVEAGLALMQQAEHGNQMTPRRRSLLYRNGLMIALLALCPVRLKNFAALKVGFTFRMTEDRWLISLPGSDTKSGRSDKRVVPIFLCPAIDKYIAEYRLPTSSSPALWTDRAGAPLGYCGTERAVTEATRSALGIAVSPHLFRSCAASTAYRHAGRTPGLAAALLQHTDPRVTELHYNRARSASFAMEYGRIIEE